MPEESKLTLPYEFNVDVLSTAYTNQTRFKTQKQTKQGLRWLKERTNIKVLNDETMKQIDNFLSNVRSNGYSDEKFSSKTVSCFVGRCLASLTGLFEYSFELARSPYAFRYALTRETEEETSVMLIPNCLKSLKDTDPKFYEVLLKVVRYLDSTSLAENTKHGMLQGGIIFIRKARDLFVNGEKTTREDLVECLQTFENDNDEKIHTRNPNLESKSLNYRTLRALATCNHFIKSGVFQNIAGCKPISKGEIKSKNKQITRATRDYFTDEEMEKIAAVYETPTERLVFTLLFTVGLRSGGVLKLRVRNLFDKDGNVLDNGTALEKGGHTRNFVIFPVLKQALEEYRKEKAKLLDHLDCFIFPSRNKRSTVAPMQATWLNDMFKAVCVRAGVSGEHVHLHACRKTVVVKLMKDGNTLENVSKFIGHKNPAVTASHYWVTTPNELVASMNISWLVGPVVCRQKSFDENNKNFDANTQDHNSGASGPSPAQIERIATSIAEGFKAQERLTHAVSLMTPQQLEKMELLWTEESRNNVALKTRNVMIAIAQTGTYMTGSSFISTSDEMSVIN
jgi:site-specific recombinase XerD